MLYCTVCGEEISRTRITLAKTAHTTPEEPLIENEVEPTCIAEGSYDEVYYCAVCGEEISRTTVPVEKTEHSPGDYEQEIVTAATCEAEGLAEEVLYCTVCGEELSRTPVTLAKTDHAPGDPVKENEVESTCTAGGHYDQVVYCTICGTELSRDTWYGLDLGHTPRSGTGIVTDPTCTESGYTTYICDRCGESYIDEFSFTDPLGHDYVISYVDGDMEMYESIVTEDGVTYAVWGHWEQCSRCDDLIQVEEGRDKIE